MGSQVKVGTAARWASAALMGCAFFGAAGAQVQVAETTPQTQDAGASSTPTPVATPDPTPEPTPTAVGTDRFNLSSDDAMVRAAAAYAGFQTDVSEQRGRMSSAEELDSALSAIGGHNSDQLTRGWIAYSALVAAQSEEYADAVRDIDGYYGRETTLKALKYDRAYWRRLKHGNIAVDKAVRAADADAIRLRSAGAQVKEQSYSLQSLGWAKRKLNDTGGFATSLEAAALAGRPLRSSTLSLFSTPEAQEALALAGRRGAPSLWDNVSSATSQIRLPSLPTSLGYSSSARVSGEYQNTADHIATSAAYAILGLDDEASSDLIQVLSEPVAKDCMAMAQLQLRGCVAANHFAYERPFCTGEYLNDLSKCIDGLGQ